MAMFGCCRKRPGVLICCVSWQRDSGGGRQIFRRSHIALQMSALHLVPPASDGSRSPLGIALTCGVSIRYRRSTGTHSAAGQQRLYLARVPRSDLPRRPRRLQFRLKSSTIDVFLRFHHALCIKSCRQPTASQRHKYIDIHITLGALTDRNSEEVVTPTLTDGVGMQLLLLTLQQPQHGELHVRVAQRPSALGAQLQGLAVAGEARLAHTVATPGAQCGQTVKHTKPKHRAGLFHCWRTPGPRASCLGR